MTWSQIKKAVERAGIRASDEILAIECEVRNGNGTLRMIPQGKFIRLAEEPSKEAGRDASGCAC
jgi:hypothetical protein